MSYDLLFYKHKDNNLTVGQIGEYLSNNLVPVNENGNQWFFENEDTGVYYSFETNDPDEGDEIEELPDSFKNFDDTGIIFNLNFVRPSFFGEEAFSFVRKYKKLFKTVEDMVLLTRDDFNSAFSSYFEPYQVSETIIIHPDKAASIEKVFNSVKSDLNFKKHLEKIASDSITNATKDE